MANTHYIMRGHTFSIGCSTSKSLSCDFCWSYHHIRPVCFQTAPKREQGFQGESKEERGFQDR